MYILYIHCSFVILTSNHYIASCGDVPSSLLPAGLCVRSVCWAGEKVLVGTKDSEVVEVTVQDKDNPTVITQVCVIHLQVQCVLFPLNTYIYNVMYIHVHVHVALPCLFF